MSSLPDSSDDVTATRTESVSNFNSLHTQHGQMNSLNQPLNPHDQTPHPESPPPELSPPNSTAPSGPFPQRPSLPIFPSSSSSSASSNIIDLDQYNHNPSRQPTESSNRPPYPLQRRSTSYSGPSVSARPPAQPQTDEEREAAYFSVPNDIMRRIFTVVPPTPSPTTVAQAIVPSKTTSVFSSNPQQRNACTEPPSPSRLSPNQQTSSSREIQTGSIASGSSLTSSATDGILSALPKSLVPEGFGKWWSGSGSSADDTSKVGANRISPAAERATRQGQSLDLDRNADLSTFTPDERPFFTNRRLQDAPSTSTEDINSQLFEALSSPLGLPASTPSASLFSSSTHQEPSEESSHPFIPPPPLQSPAQAHFSPLKPNSSRISAVPSHSTPTSSASLLCRPSPKSTLIAPTSSLFPPTLHPLQRSPTLSSLESLRLVQTANQNPQQRAFSGGSSMWRKEHKEMLDGMLDKEDKLKGGTMEEQEAMIRSKHQTPRNPIIFCHGVSGRIDRCLRDLYCLRVLQLMFNSLLPVVWLRSARSVVPFAAHIDG